MLSVNLFILFLSYFIFSTTKSGKKRKIVLLWLFWFFFWIPFIALRRRKSLSLSKHKQDWTTRLNWWTTITHSEDTLKHTHRHRHRHRHTDHQKKKVKLNDLETIVRKQIFVASFDSLFLSSIFIWFHWSSKSFNVWRKIWNAKMFNFFFKIYSLIAYAIWSIDLPFLWNFSSHYRLTIRWLYSINWIQSILFFFKKKILRFTRV